MGPALKCRALFFETASSYQTDRYLYLHHEAWPLPQGQPQ